MQDPDRRSDHQDAGEISVGSRRNPDDRGYREPEEAKEERRAHQTGLREQANGEAMGVERLFLAVPLLQIRDEEIVDADSLNRMALELDQPDAPEVVPVAAETAEMRGRANRLTAVLEAVPRGAQPAPRVNRRDAAHRHDERHDDDDDARA